MFLDLVQVVDRAWDIRGWQSLGDPGISRVFLGLLGPGMKGLGHADIPGVLIVVHAVRYCREFIHGISRTSKDT